MTVKDLKSGKYYWCKVKDEDFWRIVITFTDDKNVLCMCSFLSTGPVPVSELEEDLYSFKEVQSAEDKVKERLHRFFELLNSAETNDYGYLRRHVKIGCSRIMVMEELGKLMKELEAYCEYKLPQWQVDLMEEERKEKEDDKDRD